MVLYHALLHFYPTTHSNTSTGMIWVTQTANHQGISPCLESRRPVYKSVIIIICCLRHETHSGLATFFCAWKLLRNISRCCHYCDTLTRWSATVWLNWFQYNLQLYKFISLLKFGSFVNKADQYVCQREQTAGWQLCCYNACCSSMTCVVLWSEMLKSRRVERWNLTQCNIGWTDIEIARLSSCGIRRRKYTDKIRAEKKCRLNSVMCKLWYAVSDVISVVTRQ